jgi:spermidine synthase
MWSAVLILIGFTAVIAQILLVRELIVVFCGNEISLGLMLCAWMLWTAVGSGLLGRVASRADPRKLVAALESGIAVALPASIVAVRLSRAAFQSLPGEMLGPGPMLLTALVALGGFCVLSGWLFAAVSRAIAADRVASTAQATGSAYLLEAAGSGAGGLLAGLVLIRYWEPLEIAAFAGLLNVAAAAMLAGRGRRARLILAGAVTAAFAFLVFLLVVPRLEDWSIRQLWRGFHIEATRNSVYGNLVVTGTEDSTSLYESGLVMLTAPDPATAEESVHFALLEHLNPRSVLLIGGGANGSLAEVLKHPAVARLDYVELDPAIDELASRFFAGQWTGARNDARVHVHHTDGRLFVKTTTARYDVIIINLPDPRTAQLNRFYTVEFYEEAARCLNPGGVVSFQLTASENYISPGLAEFLRCVNKTLRHVFPEVVVIPGDWVHFFATTRAGVLTSDADTLLSRLRERRLETSYVREYYLPFRLTAERMRDLDAQIAPRPDTPLNRDFAPIAYYFDTSLWSTRFNIGYRRVFDAVARVGFPSTAVGTALMLLAMAVVVRSAHGIARDRATAGFSVAASGMTLIGLEMLLLLGFQAIYGYVYHQLAIVIAAFMAGISLGGWFGLRASTALPIRRMAALQLLAAVAAPILCMVLVGMSRLQNSAASGTLSSGLFAGLAVACGLLGGYAFPIASRVFFAGSATGLENTGSLYAIDLAGSCIGAVAVSAYWIPVFGFMRTALLLAIINLAPAVLALRSTLDARSAIASARQTPTP